MGGGERVDGIDCLSAAASWRGVMLRCNISSCHFVNEQEEECAEVSSVSVDINKRKR